MSDRNDAPSKTNPQGEELSLSQLKVGQIVRIQLAHWPVWEFAQVDGFRRRHCQLHGEFIDRAVTFRKLKRSGRPSYSYDVGESEPPILLRIASADEFESARKDGSPPNTSPHGKDS